MVRFFAWLFKLIFGRKSTSVATTTEPKIASVAPLRQDDRDKSIVIRIDGDESAVETEADVAEESAGVITLERHADEEFPVPTFTSHHHHF